MILYRRCPFARETSEQQLLDARERRLHALDLAVEHPDGVLEGRHALVGGQRRALGVVVRFAGAPYERVRVAVLAFARAVWWLLARRRACAAEEVVD